MQVLALPTVTDQAVPSSHIDDNGHMNIAHYFAEGGLAIWRVMQDRVMGTDYIETRGRSFFTVEHRIRYLGELREGERYSTHAAPVARTDKAVHAIGLVVDRERDRLACTMEVVFVHVDMTTRRSAPIPDDLTARLDAEMAAHPWIAEVATGLSLRR